MFHKPTHHYDEKTFEFEFEDFLIHVTRKKIKSIRLAIKPPNGHIVMSVPHRLSTQELYFFLVEKKVWLKTNIKHFKDLPTYDKRDLTKGGTVRYKGMDYELQFKNHQRSSITVIERRDRQALVIYINASRFKHEDIKKAIVKFYRNNIKQEVAALIAAFEPKMNVRVKTFGIKQMKTKWGTCNTRDHRIWINLSLIKYSHAALKNVVIHEMCHLLVRNHSKEFYSKMDLFYPDWRLTEFELKTGIFDDLELSPIVR